VRRAGERFADAFATRLAEAVIRSAVPARDRAA
jgi:hypothetical protein